MATLIVNKGKGIEAARMIGTTPSQAEPKYIGWGTGAGTTAAADTTLFAESTEARTAGTGSTVTTTNTGDTHQVTGTMTAAAAKTITNAGLFDASTAGSLYLKGDFTGIALNTNDTITFTFQNQFT